MTAHRAHAPSPLRIRRWLLATTLAALAVGSATPAPAVAAPEQVKLREWWYLEADPTQITMCTGDEAKIDVRAIHQVRRLDSFSQLLGVLSSRNKAQLDTIDPVGGVNIVGNTTGSLRVGYTSPSNANTNRILPPIGRAPFTFKAKDQPGRLQAIFFADGFDSVRVDIEVKKCKYLIEANSDWLLLWGWKPQTNADFAVEVVPDQDGNFDVLTPLHTHVHFTVGFMCARTISASESKARVKGKHAAGYLNFTVTYDAIPVEGSASVTCPRASGANEDPNNMPRAVTPRPIQVELQPNINRPVTLPPLVSEVEAYGVWPGHTNIKVTTIPQ